MDGKPPQLAMTNFFEQFLIQPLTRDEFFNSVWEQKPAKFQGTGIESLPKESMLGPDSIAAMLRILEVCDGEFGPLLPDGVEWLLFKNKRIIPPSIYTSPFEAYLDGCSVVVNHIEIVYPPIMDLCLALEKHFPFAYVNGYFSPPNAQAAPPHADDRDVFILQVLGSKKWKVYERVQM